MRGKTKWILFGAAVAFILFNFLRADFSAWKQLSAADLVPVIVTALASFLIRAGILSVLIIGVKKLWAWMKRK